MNELQRTADYYVFQKSLRTSWRSCIILGVIGIILGVFYTQILAPINIILSLIGLLLVIAGIRARTTLKRSSLLLSGISLSAAGVWIIIVQFLNLYTSVVINHVSSGSVLPIIVVSNIILGVGFFFDAKRPLALYRRYSANTPVKPLGQKLQEMENLIQSILKANISDKPAADPSIILFLRTAPSNLYRIKLGTTSTIIVSDGKSGIIFMRPEEFDLVDKGRTRRFQAPHNVEVRIKGAKFGEGIMWPLYLQRYEVWKNAIHAPA